MSDLTKLKSQTAAIARESKATADSLAAYKSKFTTQIGQVTATLEGSAQKVDQDMTATLQAAEQSVQRAVEALVLAANTANSYAARL